MRAFTLDDFRELVCQAAGAPESVDLRGDLSTITMGELGYESLAMMEIALRIQQEYGVALDEEKLPNMTPCELVDEVNRRNGVKL